MTDLVGEAKVAQSAIVPTNDEKETEVKEGHHSSFISIGPPSRAISLLCHCQRPSPGVDVGNAAVVVLCDEKEGDVSSLEEPVKSVFH